MPSHLGSFCWHRPSHCYSQSGMRVSLWRAHHLPFSCWFRSSTSTCMGLTALYLILLLGSEVFLFLLHRSLLRMCLGFLWAFEDYVQGWAHVRFLWASFCMGWVPVHLLLGLCKRFVVFEHGHDHSTISPLALQLHYGVSCSFLTISSWASYHWLPLPFHFVFDRCFSGFGIPW